MNNKCRSGWRNAVKNSRLFLKQFLPYFVDACQAACSVIKKNLKHLNYWHVFFTDIFRNWELAASPTLPTLFFSNDVAMVREGRFWRSFPGPYAIHGSADRSVNNWNGQDNHICINASAFICLWPNKLASNAWTLKRVSASCHCHSFPTQISSRNPQHAHPTQDQLYLQISAVYNYIRYKYSIEILVEGTRCFRGNIWTITVPFRMTAYTIGLFVICVRGSSKHFTRSAFCPPLIFPFEKRNGGQRWFSYLENSSGILVRLWQAMYNPEMKCTIFLQNFYFGLSFERIFLPSVMNVGRLAILEDLK